MLNIGGGFPARYAEQVRISPSTVHASGKPSIATYRTRCSFALDQAGRWVAEAGVLVASVIGTAVRAGNCGLHLDVGAFNGMMETLLTQNRLVYPLADSRASDDRCRYNITGPTCDSQDTRFFGVPLSRGMVPGDQVYIYTAGAYTTCYASAFNGFSVPATHCLPAYQEPPPD